MVRTVPTDQVVDPLTRARKVRGDFTHPDPGLDRRVVVVGRSVTRSMSSSSTTRG